MTDTNSERVPGEKTILVVEDERILREMESAILEDCGFRTLQAESGQKALDFWDTGSEKIDLLLTDIVLQRGITGMELARQLLKRQPGLKIVFTSGRMAADTDQEMFKQINARYLQKPYTQSELIEVIKDALTSP